MLVVAGFLRHFGDALPFLNTLLVYVCEIQRFLRQFSRRGWLHFLLDVDVKQDFAGLENEVASLFQQHLGSLVPALRGIIMNLSLRNHYVDGEHRACCFFVAESVPLDPRCFVCGLSGTGTESLHKSLTVQYVELMVLADGRHRADAVIMPSTRMMKEVCRQLGVRCTADNRAEVAITMETIRRRVNTWGRNGNQLLH